MDGSNHCVGSVRCRHRIRVGKAQAAADTFNVCSISTACPRDELLLLWRQYARQAITTSLLPPCRTRSQATLLHLRHVLRCRRFRLRQMRGMPLPMHTIDQIMEPKGSGSLLQSHPSLVCQQCYYVRHRHHHLSDAARVCFASGDGKKEEVGHDGPFLLGPVVSISHQSQYSAWSIINESPSVCIASAVRLAMVHRMVVLKDATCKNATLTEFDRRRTNNHSRYRKRSHLVQYRSPHGNLHNMRAIFSCLSASFPLIFWRTCSYGRIAKTK